MLIVIALSIIKIFDLALYKVIKSKYITDVNGPQIFIYMADYFFESFWMIVRQNLIFKDLKGTFSQYLGYIFLFFGWLHLYSMFQMKVTSGLRMNK